MTINELDAYGANTTEGMRRCMNNENFYLRLVKIIPADPNFQKLCDSINQGDLSAAFHAAHTIKGSAGNLALTPIFDPVCEITELLREKTQMDYTDILHAIIKSRDELARICEG